VPTPTEQTRPGRKALKHFRESRSMKKCLCLGLLTVYLISGCTQSGELPTAPPVAGTPAGPPPEAKTKAAKRVMAGVISQDDLTK
jgi:hypothetical protein